MNVNQNSDRAVDPVLWERSDMRQALAARDVAAIFRLLQQCGVSQRRIAALTGQSQSEISEILGGRQVMAYDVLARIADGLGIPRGYMGLAYADGTSQPIAETAVSVEDGREDARQLLARVAEVTIGAAVLDPGGWSQPFAQCLAPVPDRVGMPDVIRLESITRGFKELDAQHGGGSCRDAVVAQAQWAQQLLRANYTEEVSRALHAALANLHHLAGWSSFDVGLYGPARRHFARALEQAKYAGEPSLVAKVLYCIGRLHLHRNWPMDALRFFQLGQLAAQESGCELTVAMLCTNEAWTYAMLGRPAQALKSVGRAEDEFARADPSDAPTWVRFFGEADLHAMIAMTHAFLPEPTAAQRATAIDGFERSLAERGSGMARSRAFELTALATVHLLDGDLDHGAAVGNQAADLAEQVRSLRVLDRLAPLEAQANEHLGHADVRHLAERIATIRAA
jgi:transcriptional regulator with XRE-family HTH domain